MPPVAVATDIFYTRQFGKQMTFLLKHIIMVRPINWGKAPH